MFTCERSSRPKAIPGPAVLATAGLSRSVAGCPSRCGQTLCSLRSDRQLLCLTPADQGATSSAQGANTATGDQTAENTQSVAGCPSRCGQTLCSLRSYRQLLV